MQIYLDNAATTRVCDEAAEKAVEIMTSVYGNPSSTHTLGRMARDELSAARARIAKVLSANNNEIYFTSGGTESNNWAILEGAKIASRHGKHVISSNAEHDSVRKSIQELESRGYEITWLNPDKSGAISIEDFSAAVRVDTVFASLMLVNNETGAISDIAAMSACLKAKNPAAVFHTDAVQGFIKTEFSPQKLGADLLSISGHKIHAPKGVGALYLKSGIRIPAMLHGGSQENGKRAGTEALPLISAFGIAAELGKNQFKCSVKHMCELKNHAITRLVAENPNLLVLGGGAPHILSISLPGYKSEVIMNFLEAKGIFVSKSSACKKGGRSHVLESMGIANEIIDGAIRVSISRYSTIAEINAFCDGIKTARESLFTILR